MGGFAKQSVLRKYLISYISVAIAACTMLGALLMGISSHNLAVQEKKAVEARLASACEDLAYQMDMMDSIAFHVYKTPSYQPVFLARTSFNDITLLENFSLLSGSTVLTTEYYLLYEENLAFYTPTSKLPLSVFLRYSLFDYDMDDFMAVMNGPDSFVRIKSDDGKECLLYKKKITFRITSNGKVAYLFFHIDTDQFRERYESLFHLSDGMLLQVNGQALLGMDETLKQNAYAYELSTDRGNILFAVRKNEVGAFSNEMQWMLYVIIGMTGLFAVISALLALCSYTPIKKLALRAGVGDQWPTNEIQAISNKIDSVLRQNSASMQQLTQSLEEVAHLQESLKQQILLLALNGESCPSLAPRMAAAGIDLSDTLCVVHIAWHPKVSTDKLNRRIRGLQDSETRMYLTPLGGERGWAILLCAKNAEDVLATYDMLSDTLSAAYPDIRLAHGSLCTQVKELAYSLATAEMGQRGEAEGSETRLEEALEKLKKAMGEGKERQALLHLDVLMDRIERDYPSLMFRRYRQLEIFHQLAEFSKRMGYAPDKADKEYLPYQMGGDVRKQLENMVRCVCAKVPQTMFSQISAASRVVMEYIEQHAMEYDICLDSVATACGISTKQVSRIARSVVDMSFKEYVSNLRMKKAMELLSGGASSTETARRVGYSDISHFTKVFRNHVGMTPGQYRAQYSADAADEKKTFSPDTDEKA